MECETVMYKILYLAAGEGVIDSLPGNAIITYNDIKVQRDLVCDMLNVDLTDYDILIASPPCNYYSKANYRRDKSVYSLATRYLLPCILYKFICSNKPFIVENVINKVLMKQIIDSLPKKIFYIEIGRHCYFTNCHKLVKHANEISKIIPRDYKVAHVCSRKRQGLGGVNIVFKEFCLYVLESYHDNSKSDV